MHSSSTFTASPVEGAALFLDLDNYLDSVRFFSSALEWDFASPLHAAIEATASQFGFTLARTFGDGYLLYRAAPIDSSLFSLSSSLLRHLDTALGQHGFSFKAALVAGPFVRATRKAADGSFEVMLCGPIVNLAGKRIASLDKRMVFCSWPTAPQSTQLTFDQLTEQADGRIVAELSLDDVDKLTSLKVKSLPTVPKVSKEAAEAKLAFSAQVKAFMLEMIKLADDKAKAVFGVSVILLVYLSNGGGWLTPASLSRVSGALETLRVFSLAAALLLLLASSACGVAVLFPRAGPRHKGFISFATIAAWPSAASYAQATLVLSPTSALRENTMHNYLIAQVARQKYGWLRHSITFIGLGTVCAIVYILLSWLSGIAPTK